MMQGYVLSAVGVRCDTNYITLVFSPNFINNTLKTTKLPCQGNFNNG